MKVKDMFPGEATTSDLNNAYAAALRADTEDNIEQGRASGFYPWHDACWDCGTYHDPRRTPCRFLRKLEEKPPSGPNPYVETLHEIILNIREKERG